MSFVKFISLLAASLGLIGSLFMVRGVAVLNPKIMLHLTSPYSRIAYAPEQSPTFVAFYFT